MEKNLSEIAAKTLGDSTSYAVYTDKFDSSLLNPMPRELARKGWGIIGDEFDGMDVWRCHESTFLIDSGKPVAGTLKFTYPASSEFMVESKSMKLYLNSFDMCKMGETTTKAIQNYENQVKEDLEAILGATVRTKFYMPGDTVHVADSQYTAKNYLDHIVSDAVIFDDYEGKNNHIDLLEFNNVSQTTQRWWTNSLRSRCRHTKQKDTGAAYFAINHPQLVNPASILRQVVSLREVNEFHEFCAEKLFVEIQNNINPDKLSVALLYARRGSLDINPIRWSKNQTTTIDKHIVYSGDDQLVTKMSVIHYNTNKVFGQ